MLTRIWLGFAAVSLFALAFATPLPLAEAATECAPKPPQKATGQWVYRTVQGRKCWYRGPQVIPKSELVWPRHDGEIETADDARDAHAALPKQKTPVDTQQMTTGMAANPGFTTGSAVTTEAAFGAFGPAMAPLNAIPQQTTQQQRTTPQTNDTFEARWRGETR
jgi:hypothetical protein